MKFYDENLDIAFKTKGEIRQIQEGLLREHLVYCKNKSPYYKNLLRDISAADFTLEDLEKLPVTDKAQFIENNDDFLAADYRDIVDLALSSGTTGEPAKIMYTENDLKRLAYNEKKSFMGCGVTKDDTVLLTCTIDRCFIAGLAYFMGCREVGATSIRNGLSSIESHIGLLKKLKPTVIVGVPSFLHRMGEFIIENDEAETMDSVAKLICIGEPLRDEKLILSGLGKRLENIWQAKLFSTYASSECVSTFCECPAGKGGHLHSDLAIVEIVDNDGNVLGNGDIGEVVITPLGCTGMPLIRFRTGDISFIDNEKCECGRNTPRLGPILGRKNQMLKIQGTTVFPQAIYSVLDGFEEVKGYYIEVSESDTLSDKANIYLCLQDNNYSVSKIEDALRAKLRVKVPVFLQSPEEIVNKVFNNNSRKQKKFFDLRKYGSL